MTELPGGQPRTNYGHYEVEAVLGQGAMGTVYLARDRRIGRRVALKTIQVDERQLEDSTGDTQFLARLQREAELSGALTHPNIVTLYEAGYEGNRISFLAIEYIEGESLQTLLKKRGSLGVYEALQIAQEILKGLAYAHGKGVIHRDIKPGNILINAEGQVKIADFGIARPTANSNLTAAGMLMGTPNYMAPEQVKGQSLTSSSDLFSTAVVLYQMLTGVKPFAGKDIPEILYKIVHDPAPSLRKVTPAIPESVVNFVERLMAKDPEARFASARQAVEELERISDTVTPTTPISITAPALPGSTESTLVTDRTDATRFDRTVPTRIFLSVAAIVAMTVLVVIVMIAQRTDSSPSIEISQQKLREFEQKRRTLQAAEAFYQAGNYEESARQYEEYLKRYPNSPAAVEGLQRAREAAQEFKIVEEAQKGQPGAKKPPTKKKKKEEDWLLQQIKKAVGDL